MDGFEGVFFSKYACFNGNMTQVDVYMYIVYTIHIYIYIIYLSNITRQPPENESISPSSPVLFQPGTFESMMFRTSRKRWDMLDM